VTDCQVSSHEYQFDDKLPDYHTTLENNFLRLELNPLDGTIIKL
jgi:hypothetical protein